MLGYVERNRAVVERMILAAVLPWVAGAVNASSFFIVGAYVSHVTGSVSRVGDQWAHNRTGLAVGAACMVVAFFIGAVAATVLVELSSRQKKARYTSALATEAVCLYLFTLLSPLVMAGTQQTTLGQFLLGALLAFAMGIQNAMVSRISGAVVRTTHLTGVMTDLGVEVGRYVMGARHPSALRRLGILLTIFSSFLGGVFMGPAMYLRIGALAMLVPASVLLLLIAFDMLMGLGTRSHPTNARPGEGTSVDAEENQSAETARVADEGWGSGVQSG